MPGACNVEISLVYVVGHLVDTLVGFATGTSNEMGSVASSDTWLLQFENWVAQNRNRSVHSLLPHLIYWGLTFLAPEVQGDKPCGPAAVQCTGWDASHGTVDGWSTGKSSCQLHLVEILCSVQTEPF